ncbi:HS12A-like protein [Mya arenaria]|uniref:HS12A-like protein n=1 Tax=Mya arenaria TaxID=6604 RepID=A0ABY7DSG1_MYAAR|nr:HS12A-like protein [Mya arenaria]
MDKKYRDDLNRKRMVKQATRNCPEANDKETHVKQPYLANRERRSADQKEAGGLSEDRRLLNKDASKGALLRPSSNKLVHSDVKTSEASMSALQSASSRYTQMSGETLIRGKCIVRRQHVFCSMKIEVCIRLDMKLNIITKNIEIKGDYNLKAENGRSIDALTVFRGTVDVTVHEVLPNGRLKELYTATGGKWGGMVVNKKFWSFIAELVGDQVFESFVNNNKDDYFDLLDDFESKKRVADPGSTSTITIKIPTTLQEQFRKVFKRELGEKVSEVRYENKVRLLGDKLRIDAKQFISFFDEAVGDIVAHVKELLESLSDINIRTIIMVGGFSESPVLQNAIRDAFHPGREIIIPQDASLCVMKGAVLFGHQPSMIAERKARFTFGFAMVKHFKRAEHPKERKIEIDGEAVCNDLFDKHVEIGETVKYGETQAEKCYFPMSPNDTVFPVALFRSTDPNPKFVDERSCDCVGYFLVKRPTESKGSIDQIRIRLILGNSDISVETVTCDGSVEKSDFKINET